MKGGMHDDKNFEKNYEQPVVFTNCEVNINEINIYEARHKKSKYTIRREKIMYIVKDDQVDVGYQLAFTVLDAEGAIVPKAELAVSVVSDNLSSVVITPDDADPMTGKVSFGGPNADGTPSVANINVTVALQDGTVIGSFGDMFTVTSGDPKAIAGGSITFAGLTPASQLKK